MKIDYKINTADFNATQVEIALLSTKAQALFGVAAVSINVSKSNLQGVLDRFDALGFVGSIA